VDFGADEEQTPSSDEDVRDERDGAALGSLCGEDVVCYAPGRCVEDRCCQPECKSKQCGDDGCGGSCGGCDDGLTCYFSECRACGCEYVVCGWDGCDAWCDTCGPFEECMMGVCVDQRECLHASPEVLDFGPCVIGTESALVLRLESCAEFSETLVVAIEVYEEAQGSSSPFSFEAPPTSFSIWAEGREEIRVKYIPATISPTDEETHEPIPDRAVLSIAWGSDREDQIIEVLISGRGIPPE
jgi:hypothetical protein